jgi:D-glycero-alpha-D-manno-heptose-7-phosphate kinase
MNPAVEATAPARIDLCGGTLDIWPLNLMFDKAMTVNMAVTVMARASVTARKDGGVEIVSQDQGTRIEFPSMTAVHHHHKLGLVSRLILQFLEGKEGVSVVTSSQAPAGSGLGGSSALNIALCAALSRHAGLKLAKPRILDIAKDVEAAHLGIPTGLQDYLAALRGGANVFGFPPGGVVIKKIPDGPARELERRVILFFSGAGRSSGINNWEMFRLVIGKDRRTLKLFGDIAARAGDAAGALLMGDMDGFTRAVAGEWSARAKLFTAISTPAIDKAIAAGTRAGARAARICGAGGGGCFFLIADPAERARVIGAVERTGATHMDYRIAKTGVRTKAV